VAATAQHARLGHQPDVREHLRRGGDLGAGQRERGPVGAVRQVDAAGSQRAGDVPGELDRGDVRGRAVAGEDVAHQHVGAAVGQGAELLAGVAGAQPQRGGARQVEPVAHQRHEHRVQVDRHLPGPGVAGGHPSGQRAAGRPEVHHPQRVVLRQALEHPRHLLHVLELQAQRVGEVQVRARHAVDQQRHGVGVVGGALHLDRPGGDRHRPLRDRRARGRPAPGPCRWSVRR
jgi:hypothetical protein